ncbi:MAG: hypothetical protein IH845_00800 [Nanoarchaeota archaeon]|nr:hypothetical protein [Nanoarchaeota archaeon]
MIIKLKYIEKASPPRFIEAKFRELVDREVKETAHYSREISREGDPLIHAKIKHARTYFVEPGIAIRVTQVVNHYEPIGEPGEIEFRKSFWYSRKFTLYGDKKEDLEEMATDIIEDGTGLDQVT